MTTTRIRSTATAMATATEKATAAATAATATAFWGFNNARALKSTLRKLKEIITQRDNT